MSTSSITTTTRDDLSLLYKALRVCIRPLRPRLVKPGNPLPSGSPKLSPPANLRSRIQQHQASGLNLYTYKTGSIGTRRAHHIYYFAGGGFQSPPAKEHWKLCNELASRLDDRGFLVTLVSYPLAPNSPAPESLPALQTWLREAAAKANEDGETIILAGDSAGGNVVLNLALWWAELIVSHPIGVNPVKQVLAISPATDLTNTNPDIKEADKSDPTLTIGLTTDVAIKWAGSWGVHDPRVNTNLSMDFPALRTANIKIHGVIGTADVLAPDALVFKDICEKNGIIGDWLIWKDQMHCFPLAAVYGLSEGKAGLEWIINLLAREVENGSTHVVSA